MTLRARTWARVGLVCAVGCGGEVRVSVGDVRSSIDFARCSGEQLECDESHIEDAPSASQLPELEIRDCEPAEESSWRVAWQHDVSDLPCAPFGKCRARRSAFAPDGSLWIADLVFMDPEGGASAQAGLFLGHYGPGGEVLTQGLVETWSVGEARPGRSSTFAIAGGSTGRAVVAVAWRGEASETVGWVGQYDSHGNRIGEHAELLGLEAEEQLSVKIDDTDGSVLLLAGNSASMWSGRLADSVVRKYGGLAKLDASLHLSWLQSAIVPGAVDVLVGEAGPRLITNVGDVRTDLQNGIAWYDARGNLLDRLTLDRLQQPVRSRLRDSVFVSSFTRPFEVVYREVARDGTVRWALRVSTPQATLPMNSSGVSSSVEMDPDGALYRFIRRETSSVIYRVAPSRADCSFARVKAGDLEVQGVQVDARGDFYIEANRVGGVQVIGKLER